MATTVAGVRNTVWQCEGKNLQGSLKGQGGNELIQAWTGLPDLPYSVFLSAG